MKQKKMNGVLSGPVGDEKTATLLAEGQLDWFDEIPVTRYLYKSTDGHYFCKDVAIMDTGGGLQIIIEFDKEDAVDIFKELPCRHLPFVEAFPVRTKRKA